MPDNSAVVVIPTGKARVYASVDVNQTTYQTLIGLGTYATLATYTYGGLQSLVGPASSGAVVVIPTNSAVVLLGIARTLATYGNIASSFYYANYGAMNGDSYGQLQVLP